MKPDSPPSLAWARLWLRTAGWLLCALVLASCNHKTTRPAVLPAETEKAASAAPEESDMQPQMNLAKTSVTLTTPDGRQMTLIAQIASSEPEKAKGLMYRSSLPESEGMLFPYDHEEELGFYMANCYISLDMIFMNRDKVVIGIMKRAKPMDPTVLTIGKPSQYVLEVNGGFTDRHNIAVGTRLAWDSGKGAP
ncbi:DUF192 domain-containing protein [Myxococcota bacterium]|nr:DUF192 domain-containing protein [Myxococcota bacterium]